MNFRAGLAAALALIFACSRTPAPDPVPWVLTQRLGCLACHSLQGRGETGGANLDGIGARRSRGELETILTYPRRLLPHVKMPSYAYLPPQEIQSLVDFLTQQH